MKKAFDTILKIIFMFSDPNDYELCNFACIYLSRFFKMDSTVILTGFLKKNSYTDLDFKPHD